MSKLPLICYDNPYTPLLYVILPPPLHLILLGPVNHIINHLKHRWNEIVNMILAVGFPKDVGRVLAPFLIVSNDVLTLIGRNTHDTDPTVRPMGVMML